MMNKVVILCLLGAFLGGLISYYNSLPKETAIDAAELLAYETRDYSYAVAAEIGREEVKNNMIAGIGIGGIAGALIGLGVSSLGNKSSS